MLKSNKYGGKVVVTTDVGAGSSGKGCINAWLADKYDFKIATCNWFPNAGHYVEIDGKRILTQQIPSAFVNKNITLYINAGSGICIKTLLNEIDMLDDMGYNVSSRLIIHPNANVITEDNKETERQKIKSGTTAKGCGAAAASKAMRQQKLARDYPEIARYVTDFTTALNEAILAGESILVEMAQGMDLCLNHAEYPYCTSRQVVPTQALADAGIPAQALTNVVANLRCHPIRINNKNIATGEHCYTGNYWDAKEISWEQVALEAGYASYEEFLNKYEKSVLTSVTKMPRRIFSWPHERFKYNMNILGYDYDDTVLLSLNFINFVDRKVDCVDNAEKLMTDKVVTWLRNNLNGYTERLRWIRTGPEHNEMVEFPHGIQSWLS